MIDTTGWTAWQRFWHAPIRAERLALTRILFALALLTDQLLQFLPIFPDLYGPGGFYPQGLEDQWLLDTWRWPILFFNTDDLRWVYPLFFFWMGVTVAFLLGWKTRSMNVVLWLLCYAFITRTQALRTGAEDVMMATVFLLLLAPCGHAFALDLKRRRREPPVFTPAWPLRLLQIQLCVIYLTTGLAKVLAPAWYDGWFTGAWWDGTALHYVFCKVHMTRWSFAQLPLPFWLTAAMTYTAVWWEVLFTLLVCFRRTRRWALWFGVLFHIVIYVTLEVGWFSFYTLALYGVWVPGEFWDRFRRMPEKRE
ncbi:MAG: HTTM domain-containing protein [Planctomycetes bacterium]|nr:HTTM domain-containing protein [Planctomycetota bacterium]